MADSGQFDSRYVELPHGASHFASHILSQTPRMRAFGARLPKRSSRIRVAARYFPDMELA